MTKRILVGQSENGIPVFLDQSKSHATLHVNETPNLLELVKEVIVQMTFKDEKVAIEEDLERVIGKTSLVEVPSSDDQDIVYAKRKERSTYMRFVKNREMSDTSFLTVILHKTSDGYDLWTAWIGKLAPPTPDSLVARPESKAFWSSHALVYDSRIIQDNTETTKSPW